MPLRTLICGIFILFPSLSYAACNTRPPTETVYQLQASDHQGCIKITNASDVVTVELPAAETLDPFVTTIFNTTGLGMVSARPIDLLPAPGTSVKINNYASYTIMPAQSAQVWSDGSGYLVHSGMPTPQWSKGVGSLLTLTNYGMATGGFHFTLDTACRNGDVVGFDLSWAGQAPISFRTSIQCIATGFHEAMTDLAQQVAASAPARAVIGESVDVPAILKRGLYKWILYFDADHTFKDKNPVITPYKSPGAVEVIEAALSSRTGTLDTGGFACSHDSLARGREIKRGDALCGFYVGGTTSGPENLYSNPRDALPFYSRGIWSAMDTRTGFTSSELNFIMSDVPESSGRVRFSNSTFVVTPLPFSKIEACNSFIAGADANVSDSPVSTWGANVTAGGGSNNVHIRCNGTNWTVTGR